MRKRMITRTIKVNTVDSMVTNIKTATVENHVSIITGDYDKETIAKMVCKEVHTESPDLVFACVTSIETEERIYGMPEEEFMLYAKEVTR